MSGGEYLSSFSVASGATAYPTADGWTGTATAGSSALITAAGSTILFWGFIVEVEGSAAGVLTVGDHSGSPAMTFDVVAATTNRNVLLPRPILLGSASWVGFRAALSGTGFTVRVLYSRVR